MTCFQIPGNNGEVVLETIIRIAPVQAFPYHYAAEVTCQHGITFNITSSIPPGADAGEKLEAMRYLEDILHQLHVAINTLPQI